MIEVLFARKFDVDALNASIADTVSTLASADFITGSVQSGLDAERVATASTSIVPVLGVGQITWERAALSGDVSAAQNDNTLTLATVNANIGSFGTASQVGSFTVNGKGLITAASNVAIAITSGQISDFVEAVQDVAGSLFTGSEGTGDLDWTYTDAANTLTAVVKASAITYAKMQNVSAAQLLGNPTGGVAAPSEISLNATLSFTGTSLQRAALTGDVTAAAGSNSTTIANDAVTYAKMQNVSATDRLLGRQTAGAGDVEEITCTAAGRALLDDAAASNQRTTLGLGTIATFDETTAAEYRANTADKALSTDQVWAAADLVTLTDAATISVDMAAGFNFTVTLGGNRTLDAPTNTKNGQTGVIYVVQDGTGSRTLNYHANWKFAGGVDPTVSTAANAVDVLYYQIRSSTFIVGSLAKGLA